MIGNRSRIKRSGTIIFNNYNIQIEDYDDPAIVHCTIKSGGRMNMSEVGWLRYAYHIGIDVESVYAIMLGRDEFAMFT